MRRMNGRFAKEPRRGVDPDEQRQIQDFIVRNGVKRVDPMLYGGVSPSEALQGRWAPDRFFAGAIKPRRYAE